MDIEIESIELRGNIIDGDHVDAMLVEVTDNEYCELDVTYEIAVGSPDAKYYTIPYYNLGEYGSEDIIINEGYVVGATYFIKRMVNGKQFGKPTSATETI